MHTIESFDSISEIIEKDLVMIVAKTHTCSTCKQIVDHLNQNVKRINEIENYQIFVDDMDRFRGEYVIFSVPTVLIFSNGKELLRESRFINIDKINRLIDMVLE